MRAMGAARTATVVLTLLSGIPAAAQQDPAVDAWSTPAALTVLDAEWLERANVESLADAAALAPGALGFGEGESAVLEIRAASAFRRGEVVSLVNGLFDPLRLRDRPATTFDAERVLFRRGPEIALGPGGLPGSVDVTWRKPHGACEAFGDVTAGSHERAQLRAAVNAPLLAAGDERLTGRLALQGERGEGGLPREDVDARASLRSRAGGADLVLRGWWSRREEGESAGDELRGADAELALLVGVVPALGLLRLDAAGGVRDFDLGLYGGATPGATGGSPWLPDVGGDHVTFDVRLGMDDRAPFGLAVGAFYSDLRVERATRFDRTGSPVPYAPLTAVDETETTRHEAQIAEAWMHPFAYREDAALARLAVFGGVRLTQREERRQIALEGPRLSTRSATVARDDATWWEAGVRWPVTADHFAYAKYTEERRADGTRAWEAGWRSRWWERRLELQLVAFHDRQQDDDALDDGSHCLLPHAAFAPRRRARSFGAEAQAALRPLAGLRLEAGAAYLHTRADLRDEILCLAFAREGEIDLAPAWEASLFASYELSLGRAGTLVPIGRAVWIDDFFLAQRPPASVVVEPGWNLDARLRWLPPRARWWLEGFVEDAGLDEGPMSLHRSGRIYGVRLGLHFGARP
jgi:hypothetical protein